MNYAALTVEELLRAAEASPLYGRDGLFTALVQRLVYAEDCCAAMSDEAALPADVFDTTGAVRA